MDSLLRNEKRDRIIPMPMPTVVRPPLAQQTNVVDLTTEDPPLPSSHHSRPLQTQKSSGYPPLPSKGFQHAPPPLPSPRGQYSRPPAQSWQLPSKSKHAAPSKVRMIEVTSVPSSSGPLSGPDSDKPLPSSSFNSPRRGTNSHTARQYVKDGVEVVKHAIKDGFARAQHAVEQANAHSMQANGDSDEDYGPLPSTFAGPTMTAEEREQQLQDMLSSMVLPPELGDIDLEKASNIEGLRCKLMPHQVAGYLWLKGREGGKHKGGILADDMGLGKTVQMLALIVGNAPSRVDTTMDKVRHEPENPKKSKKKVILDSDDSVPDERLEIRGKCTLIIAPLAVIRQWEREIKEKTQPGLKVLVHHGASRTKLAASFARYDVVITTYPTVASEWNNVAGVENPKKGKKGQKKNVIVDSSDEDEEETRQSDSSAEFESTGAQSKGKANKSSASAKKAPAPLFEVDWLRIVLDEAQNIKNHRTKASGACAALSRRALSKWCLTGTPIQNEALEMFSLIRFLAIPPFDEYSHFREKISDPLKSTNQNRVNWGMKRLCAVLTTIMLRRTKDTLHDGKPIITLPGRHVEVVSSDFDDDKERAFYDDLESQVKRNFEEAEGTGNKVNHMVSLVMLLRLRQACCHPHLVRRSVRVDAGAASGPAIKDNGQVSQADDDDGLTELLAGLSVATKRCDRCQAEMTREEVSLGGVHCTACLNRIRNEEATGNTWSTKSSTKVRSMLRLLDDIRKVGDEKTIVFSQFTSFLDILEPILQREGHTFVRYDGALRPEERERALDRIRSDPSIRLILISFRAGNVGLNLTCCSRVILMDLWWNPMLEAQAIDRAHRLGQEKDVHVYKLVINHSVEERILALQDKKRALAEAALEGSKLSKANRLDRRELMYLFSGGPVA